MNKLYKTFLYLLVLSLVLLSGCGGDSGKLTTGNAPETAPASESQEAPPSEDSSLEEEAAPIYITFEGKNLEGNVVSQDIFSQSRLTMVNVWATYCNPCLNEMPGLGELAAESDRRRPVACRKPGPRDRSELHALACQRLHQPSAPVQCKRRAHHLLF